MCRAPFSMYSFILIFRPVSVRSAFANISIIQLFRHFTLLPTTMLRLCVFCSGWLGQFDSFFDVGVAICLPAHYVLSCMLYHRQKCVHREEETGHAILIFLADHLRLWTRYSSFVAFTCLLCCARARYIKYITLVRGAYPPLT